jgi:hypothetical protein
MSKTNCRDGRQIKATENSNEFSLRGFKEFNRSAGRITEKAVVSLTTFKIINFNKRICLDFIHEEDQFVNLFYNPESRIVGIKLLPRPDENSYKLRKSNRGKFAALGAYAFFDYWQIDHSKTRQYEARHDIGSHVIYFDLNKPIKEL